MHTYNNIPAAECGRAVGIDLRIILLTANFEILSADAETLMSSCAQCSTCLLARTHTYSVRTLRRSCAHALRALHACSHACTHTHTYSDTYCYETYYEAHISMSTMVS